jgi:hypothetical protein
MEVVEAVVVIVTLAAAIEYVVEGTKPMLAPVVSAVRLPESVPVYRYEATLLGVLFAVLYQANVLAVLGLAPPSAAADAAGVVLTGVLLAFGSSGVHDFLQQRGAR